MTVNKISWHQLARATEPGRYEFSFGWLTITAEDLAVWDRFPGALFTLVRNGANAEEYRLGAFDLPVRDG